MKEKKGNPFKELPSEECPICKKVNCESLSCYLDKNSWEGEINRHSRQGEWAV